jgi:hypothetical protein
VKDSVWLDIVKKGGMWHPQGVESGFQDNFSGAASQENLAWELSCKTHYRREDRREWKTRKEM